MRLAAITAVWNVVCAVLVCTVVATGDGYVETLGETRDITLGELMYIQASDDGNYILSDFVIGTPPQSLPAAITLSHTSIAAAAVSDVCSGSSDTTSPPPYSVDESETANVTGCTACKTGHTLALHGECACACSVNQGDVKLEGACIDDVVSLREESPLGVTQFVGVTVVKPCSKGLYLPQVGLGFTGELSPGRPLSSLLPPTPPTEYEFFSFCLGRDGMLMNLGGMGDGLSYSGFLPFYTHEYGPAINAWSVRADEVVIGATTSVIVSVDQECMSLPKSHYNNFLDAVAVVCRSDTLLDEQVCAEGGLLEGEPVYVDTAFVSALPTITVMVESFAFDPAYSNNQLHESFGPSAYTRTDSEGKTELCMGLSEDDDFIVLGRRALQQYVVAFEVSPQPAVTFTTYGSFDQTCGSLNGLTVTPVANSGYETGCGEWLDVSVSVYNGSTPVEGIDLEFSVVYNTENEYQFSSTHAVTNKKGVGESMLAVDAVRCTTGTIVVTVACEGAGEPAVFRIAVKNSFKWIYSVVIFAVTLVALGCLAWSLKTWCAAMDESSEDSADFYIEQRELVGHSSWSDSSSCDVEEGAGGHASGAETDSSSGLNLPTGNRNNNNIANNNANNPGSTSGEGSGRGPAAIPAPSRFTTGLSLLTNLVAGTAGPAAPAAERVGEDRDSRDSRDGRDNDEQDSPRPSSGETTPSSGTPLLLRDSEREGDTTERIGGGGSGGGSGGSRDGGGSVAGREHTAPQASAAFTSVARARVVPSTPTSGAGTPTTSTVAPTASVGGGDGGEGGRV